MDKHSKLLDEGSRYKTLVLVAHIPPEFLHLSSQYNTIYGGGWNFVFVDSVGVNAVNVSTPHVDRATSEWILAGFGIADFSTVAQDLQLKQDFLNTFKTVGELTCNSPRLPPLLLQQFGLQALSNLNVVCSELVKTLFVRHDWLLDRALNRFFCVWSRGFLLSLLDHVCEIIVKGTSVMSFSHAIRATISLVLTHYVFSIVERFVSDSNLAAVVDFLVADPAKPMAKLVADFVCNLPVMLSEDSIRANLIIPSFTMPATPRHRSCRPSIPFVDFICSQVMAKSNVAVREFSMVAAEAALVAEPLLERYASALNQDEKLLSDFKRDVVKRSVLLHSMFRESAVVRGDHVANLVSIAVALVERSVERMNCTSNCFSFICAFARDVDVVAYCLRVVYAVVTLDGVTGFVEALEGSNNNSIEDMCNAVVAFATAKIWHAFCQCLGSARWADLARTLATWDAVNNCVSDSQKRCLAPMNGNRFAVLTLFSVCVHTAPRALVGSFSREAAPLVCNGSENSELAPQLLNLLLLQGRSAQDDAWRPRFFRMYFASDLPVDWPTRQVVVDILHQVRLPEAVIADILRQLLSRSTEASTVKRFVDRLCVMFQESKAQFRRPTLGRPSPHPLLPSLYFAVRNTFEVALAHHKEWCEGAVASAIHAIDTFISYANRAESPAIEGVFVCAKCDAILAEIARQVMASSAPNAKADHSNHCSAAMRRVVGVMSKDLVESVKSWLRDAQHSQVEFFLSNFDSDRAHSAARAMMDLALVDASLLGGAAEAQAVRKVALQFVWDSEMRIYGPEYRRLVEVVRASLKNVSEGAALLAQEVGNDEAKAFRFRMYLFAHTFYAFGDEGQAAPHIANLIDFESVRAALRITEGERPIFAFFTKPRPFSRTDFLGGLFFDSNNADVQIAYAPSGLKYSLVNVVAVVLGSQSKSFELYTRLIDPASLMNSQGVGSGMGRIAKDCGYQVLGHVAQLQTPDGYECFRNVTLFRLAYNFMSWAAMTMGLLFRIPAVERGMADTICTYWKSDCHKRCANNDEKVRYYALERPATFMKMMLEEPSLVAAGLSGQFFLNASLMRMHEHLWQVKFASPCGPRFMTEQDVSAYENLLADQVFAYVQKHAAAIAQAQREVDGIMPDWFNKAMSLSRELKVTRTKYFPLYTSVGELKSPLLTLFFKFHPSLAVMSRLPSLAMLYDLLTNTLSGKTTKEQLRTMTMGNVLDLCANSTQGATAQLDAVIQNWNAIREAVIEIGVCQQARQNNEGQIIDLSLSTLVSELVSLDHESSDAIVRLVSEVVSRHNTFLQAAVKLVRMPEPDEIPFGAFASDGGAGLRLVASVPKNFEELLFHVLKLSTGEKGVDESVACEILKQQLVLSKCCIDAKSMRNQFVFKPTDLSEQTYFLRGDVQLDRLAVLVAKLPRDGRWKQERAAHLRRDMKKLGLNKVEGMISSAHDLCRSFASTGVAPALNADNLQKDFNKFVSRFSEISSSTSMLSVDDLPHVLRVFVEVIQELHEETNFSNAGRILNAELSDEAASEFECCLERVAALPQESARRVAAALEAAIQSLREVANVLVAEQTAGTMSLRPDEPLINIAIRAVGVREVLSERLKQRLKDVLPQSVQCQNFGPVVRRIRMLCCRLLAQLGQERNVQFFTLSVPVVLPRTAARVSQDKLDRRAQSPRQLLFLEPGKDLVEIAFRPFNEVVEVVFEVHFRDEPPIRVVLKSTDTVAEILFRSETLEFVQRLRSKYVDMFEGNPSLQELHEVGRGHCQLLPLDLALFADDSSFSKSLELTGEYIRVIASFSPFPSGTSQKLQHLALYKPVTAASVFSALERCQVDFIDFIDHKHLVCLKASQMTMSGMRDIPMIEKHVDLVRTDISDCDILNLVGWKVAVPVEVTFVDKMGVEVAPRVLSALELYTEGKWEDVRDLAERSIADWCSRSLVSVRVEPVAAWTSDDHDAYSVVKVEGCVSLIANVADLPPLITIYFSEEGKGARLHWTNYSNHITPDAVRKCFDIPTQEIWIERAGVRVDFGAAWPLQDGDVVCYSCFRRVTVMSMPSSTSVLMDVATSIDVRSLQGRVVQALGLKPGIGVEVTVWRGNELVGACKDFYLLEDNDVIVCRLQSPPPQVSIFINFSSNSTLVDVDATIVAAALRAVVAEEVLGVKGFEYFEFVVMRGHGVSNPVDGVYRLEEKDTIVVTAAPLPLCVHYLFNKLKQEMHLPLEVSFVDFRLALVRLPPSSCDPSGTSARWSRLCGSVRRRRRCAG